MTRRADPLRVGIFTVLGVLLLAAVVVAVTGGKVFGRNERAVLHFAGSVWGLQTGAPVVLRGVRVGSVVAVGLVKDEKTGALSVPVQVDIDSRRIRDAHGGDADGTSLGSLLQSGLRAKLAQQSLLTGRLYIDLELDGPKLAALPSTRPLEIPTVGAGSMQGLQQQLEGLNVRQLVQDVSATAAAARKFLTAPELGRTVEQVALLTESLARTGALIERRIGPLADNAQGAVTDTRRAIAQLGTAAERLAQASERVGGAAGNAEKLLGADSALVTSVRQAVDDIGRSAGALRLATADDSAMMQNLDGTLAELRRTSRSVRQLAELLERQPDALLRGRAEGP